MGREEIFVDLGGGAPKTPIFIGKNELMRDLLRTPINQARPKNNGLFCCNCLESPEVQPGRCILSPHRCARPSSHSVLTTARLSTAPGARLRAPATRRRPATDGRRRTRGRRRTSHASSTAWHEAGCTRAVGRACDAPRTSLPRRQACASACCTTPARKSYARRT